MKPYLHNNLIIRIICLITVLTATACSTAPKTQEGKADVQRQAAAALVQAQKNDPSLTKVLNEAAGYAIFPKVGKGGVGVGGAYGKGVLYQNGVVVGFCDLTQATIGVQLGGQTYTEIIAFETQETVERFKRQKFAFGAQASAVALKSGAGANAKYADGVSVFTMNEAGLMYEAAIGGQKFSFEPR